MDMEKNKHKFSIIPKYGEYYYPDGMMFEDDKGDIVYFGGDNKFPQLLIELYHKSSVHSTCVNAKHQAVIGQGLTGLDESILETANKEGETWNDIFNKVALDRVLYGGFALEVIWSNDRTRIAEVYHLDYSYVRAHKCDHRGNVPGYYVWNGWGKNKSIVPYKKRIFPIYQNFSKVDRTSPISSILFQTIFFRFGLLPITRLYGFIKDY